MRTVKEGSVNIPPKEGDQEGDNDDDHNQNDKGDKEEDEEEEDWTVETQTDACKDRGRSKEQWRSLRKVNNEAAQENKQWSSTRE